ncbi:MAG: hypothetical protein FE835_10830 [Gammaproteobacteria bacterium]|nr:hypothetical protein [Gammaproteobacteria bacterium]
MHPEHHDTLDDKSRGCDTYFNPQGFAKGKALLALHDGDSEALSKLNTFEFIIYLTQLNKYYAGDYVMLDEYCTGLNDPSLPVALMRKGGVLLVLILPRVLGE